MVLREGSRQHSALKSPCFFFFSSQHTERSFFDQNGVLEKHETGFWAVDLDVNSPHIVKNIVPEMNQAVPVREDCENHLYCGMPYFIPIISFIW